MTWSCKLLYPYNKAFLSRNKNNKNNFKNVTCKTLKMRFLKGERIWDTWNTIPPRAICIIKCNSSAITSAWFFNWWTLIAITRGRCYSWWVMSKSLSHTASHGSGGGLEFLETQTPNHHQQYLTKKKKPKPKTLSPLFPVLSEFRESCNNSLLLLL